jgi:electron transfer flavoprotein alpha subunit
MRILVCVKWVPILAKLRFDPETRRLVRDGVPGEVSAFDLRALGRALALRDEHGGEVAVLTMGGPDAADGLRECLALGADRGVHLMDPALVGSDTLATARALAGAVRREAPDLVLLGRTSVDAETGQVGPELAELLDWPQVTQARRLTVDPAGTFEAERETDEGFETVAGPWPAVVTAAEDLAAERFPSKADRAAARDKPIATLALADVGVPADAVGQAGSPTWVAGVEASAVERRGEVLAGAGPAALARALAQRLRALGAFAEVGTGASLPAPTAARPGAALWVVAEFGHDGPRSVTCELLAKARELAVRLGGAVEAVVIGDGAEHADALAAAGAERVLVAAAPGLSPYTTEAHTTVLAELVRARAPRLVLLGATVRGRDLAPRVAARLGLGLTGDAIDLDVDGDGRIRQMKPAFGGAIVAPVLSSTRPEMATVRAGMLRAAVPDLARRAAIERLDAGVVRSRVRVVRCDPAGEDVAAALDAAPLVLGVGAGLGEDGIAQVRALAARLGAAVATTRDVTDAGWLPRQHQVGLTGRAIAPRLYVALAIRGAMEHMVGVRRAGIVVAINSSAKAPIRKQADLVLEADARALLPYLEDALRP